MKTKKQNEYFDVLLRYCTLRELYRASAQINRLITAKERQVKLIKDNLNINIKI